MTKIMMTYRFNQQGNGTATSIAFFETRTALHPSLRQTEQSRWSFCAARRQRKHSRLSCAMTLPALMVSYSDRSCVRPLYR
jgi:hypothetical protein